jgi:hypothetical protein
MQAAQSTNVRVVIRIRPFNKRETDLGIDDKDRNLLQVTRDMIIVNIDKPLDFSYTRCFGMESQQEDVFEDVAASPLKYGNFLSNTHIHDSGLVADFEPKKLCKFCVQ